jgi:hypothetical protein
MQKKLFILNLKVIAASVAQVHLHHPYLTKVTNQLGSTLRRPQHPFDISRTFEITVSVFHHYFKCLNLDFC